MVTRKMKFGIQLALGGSGGSGSHVAAGSCSRDDGPFSCVLCSQRLTLRAGTKTPRHFVHSKKSECSGNDDEHRAAALRRGSTGSIYEMKPRGPETDPITTTEESMLDAALDQVLENQGNQGEQEQEEKEELNVPMDISSDIIDEALDFVVNDLLKEARCTDCKRTGSGFHRMFTEEAMDTFGLNDLYVCPSCLSPCPACNGPNSTKRARRATYCFVCDFEKNQWEESAEEAVDKLGPIPESPGWLSEERKSMVLRMTSRRQSARKVFHFMAGHQHRVSEYRSRVGSKKRERAIARALKKERKGSKRTREGNQGSRERAMGADATARFNAMYANKKESCWCGKQGKRRHMIKYGSAMGAWKYCCRSCSLVCPGCSQPCVQKDLDMFQGSCFECLSWSRDWGDLWKQGEGSIIEGCRKGCVSSMAALYQYGPMLTKGKYSGDKLVHAPTTDMDAIARRDHPEMKGLVDAIMGCRKV
jgi:hypothetical protein